MNKQIRKEHMMRKYKKRIQRYVIGLDIYFCQDGREITNPKAIDIIKDNGQLKYKTMATVCSCFMCSGYYKYKRNLKKVEDYKLIQGFIE